MSVMGWYGLIADDQGNFMMAGWCPLRTVKYGKSIFTLLAASLSQGI
jgi:hypothetical protein